MPDEDPFKDDPVPETEAPAAGAPSRGATKANPAKNSHQVNDRRRVDKKAPSTLTESSPTKRVTASDEPGLLRVIVDQQDARRLMPINASGVRNPLRSETAKPRENKVVPTAGWSSDQVEASNEPGLLWVNVDRQGTRGMTPNNSFGVRNPLRSETAKPGENQVVPPADWSAHQGELNDAPGTWKRNPLRTN
ncbi:MAG: hypothetical protein HY288_09865 [Planctomycetia bacterium]|nr:hypothetical protein [Planctomycetia bacterium]